MTEDETHDALASKLGFLGVDEPAQTARDLLDWYNVRGADADDLDRLAHLAVAGRFEAWSCPACGVRVFEGRPAEWSSFQGVRQNDRTSYPGSGANDRRCDACRCHDRGAPKPTGKPPVNVTLTGMLLPYLNGSPVLLRMPGVADRFLPVFTREADLRSALKRAGAPHDKVKVVTDGSEFLASLPATTAEGAPIRIAVDIRLLPDGKVRYHEVEVGGVGGGVGGEEPAGAAPSGTRCLECCRGGHARPGLVPRYAPDGRTTVWVACPTCHGTGRTTPGEA